MIGKLLGFKRTGVEYHVRVLVLIDNAGVLELDVEVLIDRVKSSSNCQIILQLYRHFFPYQILEIRKEQLHPKTPIIHKP